MRTKNLKFNNTNISFVFVNGSWSIPAKLLGNALGYAREGQKLADALTSWTKAWSSQDFKVVRGKELASMRATPNLGVPSSTSQLMLLTPAGVIKVLQRSRSTLAADFRDFLAKNHNGIFKGLEDSLVSKTKQEKTSTLEDILKVAESASKRGLLSKPEQKKLYSRILDIQMEVFTRENKVTHFITDGTVNPTNLPALSKDAMALNEGSMRLLSITEHHPDYQDWKSAHEIGAAYGLKADLVKKYIKAYVLSLHTDLPNNLADEFVNKNNGNFPTPDYRGFLVFEGLRNVGVAIYSKIDGNKLVWRNFWSPQAVEAINGLIELDRGIQPLQAFVVGKDGTAQPVVNLTVEKGKEIAIVTDDRSITEEAANRLPPGHNFEKLVHDYSNPTNGVDPKNG